MPGARLARAGDCRHTRVRAVVDGAEERRALDLPDGQSHADRGQVRLIDLSERRQFREVRRDQVLQRKLAHAGLCQ